MRLGRVRETGRSESGLTLDGVKIECMMLVAHEYVAAPICVFLFYFLAPPPTC